MDILNTLNWRYAVKEFDKDKKLTQDQVDLVLESLRLSASSFGLQPWKFIIVEDKSKREDLLKYSWNQKQVVDASHLIVFCGPKSFGIDEIDRFLKSTAQTRGVELESLEGYGNMMKGFVEGMTDDKLKHWIKDQVYLALGSLLVTCATQKIDTCPMEGFSGTDYNKVLELDKHGLEAVVVCPIGFRADSDKYASLKKVRYPLEDVVLKI